METSKTETGEGEASASAITVDGVAANPGEGEVAANTVGTLTPALTPVGSAERRRGLSAIRQFNRFWQHIEEWAESGGRTTISMQRELRRLRHIFGDFCDDSSKVTIVIRKLLMLVATVFIFQKRYYRTEAQWPLHKQLTEALLSPAFILQSQRHAPTGVVPFESTNDATFASVLHSQESFARLPETFVEKGPSFQRVYERGYTWTKVLKHLRLSFVFLAPRLFGSRSTFPLADMRLMPATTEGQITALNQVLDKSSQEVFDNMRFLVAAFRHVFVHCDTVLYFGQVIHRETREIVTEILSNATDAESLVLIPFFPVDALRMCFNQALGGS